MINTACITHAHSDIVRDIEAARGVAASCQDMFRRHVLDAAKGRRMFAEHIAEVPAKQSCCPAGAHARYLMAAAFRELFHGN